MLLKVHEKFGDKMIEFTSLTTIIIFCIETLVPHKYPGCIPPLNNHSVLWGGIIAPVLRV